MLLPDAIHAGLGTRSARRGRAGPRAPNILYEGGDSVTGGYNGDGPMSSTANASKPRRLRVTLVSLAVAAVSLVLFAYSLRTVGVGEIGEALRRLGIKGFALVLVLSGGRLVVRTLAWMACVEGERRLPFRAALAATIMGEALGNVTPLAMLVSEPSKALFVRDRLPLQRALSAIVVENVFYTATVGAMIGLGAVAFLLEFSMPEALRLASLGAIAGMLVILGTAWWILGAGAKPASGAIAWLTRRGWGGRRLASQAERVRRFEEQINTFSSRNRARLPALALYEGAFHAAGVAEVYVTLSFIAPGSVTVVTALVLEAVGRVINVLFKFIPMRFGVDEAGNLLLARPLSLPQASLVALPLVRKARILVWTAVGILLLVMRGLSVRRTLREAEGVAAEGRP